MTACDFYVLNCTQPDVGRSGPIAIELGDIQINYARVHAFPLDDTVPDVLSNYIRLLVSTRSLCNFTFVNPIDNLELAKQIFETTVLFCRPTCPACHGSRRPANVTPFFAEIFTNVRTYQVMKHGDQRGSLFRCN